MRWNAAKCSGQIFVHQRTIGAIQGGDRSPGLLFPMTLMRWNPES
jgi:hypothetical protein